MDDGKYVLMATLDLSSAVGVVKVELLIKRIKKLGLPGDMISLISKWLSIRYFRVGLEIGDFDMHCIRVGTVQG